MSDEYLFDKSGPPDPSVERLEKLLLPFRHDRSQARSGKRSTSLAAAPGRRRRNAAAAAALLAAAAIVAALLWKEARPGHVTKFELAETSGDVRIEEGLLSSSSPADPARSDPLKLRSRVVCGAGASARVRVGDLGYVTLEERTRVRVERSAPDAEAARDGAYQLYLERGSVSATIFAAPRVFELGTPSGIAVDLGCVYKTTVDDSGHTTLSVVLGKVSFESEGRKVRVPAGASCRAVPGRGPGTPVWDDAGAEYHDAVERIDGAKSVATAAVPLKLVLTQSRARDSLTLWNLLDHPDPDVRGQTFDRLAELVPPPAGLARSAALAPPKSRNADDAGRFAEWEEKIRDEW
jgi:ferric-dicitrate binding protein FerR (iron transport regulator)